MGVLREPQRGLGRNPRSREGARKKSGKRTRRHVKNAPADTTKRFGQKIQQVINNFVSKRKGEMISLYLGRTRKKYYDALTRKS